MRPLNTRATESGAWSASNDEARPSKGEPKNLDAEQALLGAILYDNAILDRVSDFLEPQHFYDELHQEIFDAASKLIMAGKRATPITLRTYFEKSAPISATETAPQYLVRIACNVPSLTSATNYGRLIHDLALRRDIARIGKEMVEVAYDSAVDFGPAAQLAEAISRLETVNRGGEAEATPIITAASFAGKPVPRRVWNVLNMVPSDTVTTFGGDGGTGKSLIATQLGLSTAAGRQWLGLDVRKGPVLYVGAEDDLDEMHRRTAAIAERMDLDLGRLEDFHILCLAGREAVLGTYNGDGLIQPTGLWRRVCREVKHLRPVLVIYDTLADLFAGVENDRSHARQFVGMLRGLAIKSKSAAVLLAHPSLSGIQSGSGSSGSTAWSNSVRSRLYLEMLDDSDPDARVLTTKKANYAQTGLEISIRWQDGVFVPENASAPAPAVAAKNAQADRIFLELVVAFDQADRRVSPQPGSNYAPNLFALEPRAEGIGKKALEAAMRRLFDAERIKVIETGPPSRKRKTIGVV